MKRRTIKSHSACISLVIISTAIAALVLLTPNTGYSVSIIIDSTTNPVKHDSLSSTAFIAAGGGLPHFATLIDHHQPVKIAFLGGSITHMKGWRDKVTAYLSSTYPQTKFEFLDAGIPSLGSLPHAFRFKTDVLDKMTPDLLFIESAVNDAGNGTTVTEQKRALEGIIRHAHKANPKMEMVLMAFADEQKNEAFAKDSIPVSVKIHRDIAAYYQLPFINLAREVFSRIQNGEFTWEGDFKNLHPAPFGQELYFNSIRTLLESEIKKAGTTSRIASAEPLTNKKKWPEPLQALNYNQGRYVATGDATGFQGFKLISDWTPNDKAHTRPGFVHVPVLIGTAPGSSLKLKFRGTAVGIAVLSGPDAGTINYQIDGGPVRTMDLYTRWSANLHLPWYELLGDGLKDKTHELKLVIAPGVLPDSTASTQAQRISERPKTAVRIVHFLVNGPKS